ncbi:MAG TPA: RagB/SusD family nutrient uptake outer membrane protein, partial [Bacteroidales bacterium]|nr:RagB/SusD family nutrient uptake outer membrane protein [Bacteroidales bacterium]
MKLTRYIFLALISVFVVSCENDDFLDRAPGLNLDEETVFTVFENAQRFQSDIYVHLQDGFNRVGNFQPVPMASASDESDSYAGYHGSNPFNFGSYDGQDDQIYNYYSGIRKANIFLSKLDVIPFPDQKTKDALVGEVYFLRAFYFFEVIKRYGGMPIIDKVLAPGENLMYPRNTYKECVEYILKDCESAIGLLPVSRPDNEMGRITKGAAMALKARMLLYAASPLWDQEFTNPDKWQLAADAAKAVINLRDENGALAYELYNTGKGAVDYERLFFTRRNMGNKEVIFYKHESPIDFNNQQINVWAPKGEKFEGAGAVNPTQNFVDLFEMSNGKLIDEPGSGYDPNKPYLNREPRFYKTILYNGAVWQGVTVETFLAPDLNPSNNGKHRKVLGEYTSTGYYVRKYLPEEVKTKTSVQAYHNWIYFRLAEMYLNYAEATNEVSGPTPDVYAALKAVRSRSGVVDLPDGLDKEQ